MRRRWTCARWPRAAWSSALGLAVLAGCGGGGEPPQVRLPDVGPGEPCPVSPARNVGMFRGALGDGPASPVGMGDGVLELIPPRLFDSRRWGGQKILWAVEPEARRGLVVTGRRLDGPGEVRFDNGDVPKARLALPDPEPGRVVDRPGFTRLRTPGCYAYVVGDDVIVFRAVRTAHWRTAGDTIGGVAAQTVERAIVDPGGESRLAVPSYANCRAASRRERRATGFGRSLRQFSCAITQSGSTRRYTVHWLAHGCYTSALQRRPGERPRTIQGCARRG